MSRCIVKQSVPVASSVTPAASATPVSSVTPVVTVASVEPVAPLPLLVPTMSAAEVAQVSSVTVSPVPISEVAVQPVSEATGWLYTYGHRSCRFLAVRIQFRPSRIPPPHLDLINGKWSNGGDGCRWRKAK